MSWVHGPVPQAQEGDVLSDTHPITLDSGWQSLWGWETIWEASEEAPTVDGAQDTDKSEETMPNRLVNETSPYLLQHANNPVDWYPWGEEALARARAEDRPILLSIGYSACHWCHVMERESFEDPHIAGIMNEHFVSIKVDREERPDLDSLYMNAVQALTGSGGWPMTVFLTPSGEPFYGGTYFPPTDSMGRPGFPGVLLGVAQTYRERRGEVSRATQQLISHLQHLSQLPASRDPLTPDILHQSYQVLGQSYDWQNGGVGSAPKFPQPMTYEFLLHYFHLTNSPMALQMAEGTLQRMALGGIYDQIGGGFHRYSTDPYWLVPHFEKMLYDNALLARLYLHAFQATGNPFYGRIAQETLDYVLREMTSPEGGFYSTQDADSEGEEGKFFVWTTEEIESILGPEDGALVGGYFGATDAGNFEGQNILHVPQGAESYVTEAGVSIEQLDQAVARARPLLLEAREGRVHPGRDEKVLSAWNGMMMRSFAEGASILGREDYRRAAVANASFLLEAMVRDGRLLRTYKGGRASLKGYLEDYAMVVDGLLAVHEATFDQRWLEEARGLAEGMVALFWAEEHEGFFDTGSDHEELIVRPRDLFDNATPCGSSVAVDVMLRLSLLTGDEEYSRRAATALRPMQQYLARAPMGMGHWLCALDFYLSTPKEIAIVGAPSDPATLGLMQVVHGRYLPNKVIAGRDPTSPAVNTAKWPLLEGRGMVDGRPTVYVCQDYVCQLPVTDPEALAGQLGA